ncbi:MAG: FAD-dependent oxidoreductase [Blastocatellia bacterium]|nr:FAD-dependent oxidoreductase [Blastocatellia bacterium]
MSETVIIGAGPAGLTAAYELARLGIKSVVLEADDQVGGLARTVEYRGYRFDIGGHRFFSKVPAINDLWQEILGEEFLERPRLSRIYYQDRFFDYPLKPLNALAGLGPAEAMMVALSYAKARLFPGEEERSFEQWVSNRFGHRLYQTFFKTYTEKVWGIPCSEISADWAAQRIKNLSLNEALRNAFFRNGRSNDGRVITSLIEAFHYPRLGPGMMWERCEELIRERGACTMRGVRVEKILHRRGRVECVHGRTASGERVELSADNVISTMALGSLIRALDPAPPVEVLEAARGLRYRDFLTVVLIVNRESVFPDNWIYIHSPAVSVGRVQNYKNWSSDMVPDARRTSLGLEYFVWDADDIWNWPDSRLIDLGIQEAARIGLIAPDEVEDGTALRMRKAYPIYEHGYAERLALVRGYLETITNLQTIGRNGLHRYNNQDHSMLTGMYAARNIAGERLDVWSVNTDADYHEEQKTAAVSSPGVGAVPLPYSRGTEGDRLVPVGMLPEKPLALPRVVIETVFAKLDPVAMGVALGVVSGLGLFLATVILLLKGGPRVGPNLSLLSNYFIGFKVTWAGALLGLIEAGIAGFMLGFGLAWLRNLCLAVYARLLRRQVQAEEDRHFLDEV